MGHLMAGAQAAFPGATLLPVLVAVVFGSSFTMLRIQCLEYFQKMPLFSLIEQDQFPLFTIKKPNTPPLPTTQQILAGITAIAE